MFLEPDMSRRRLGYGVRKGYCRRQTIPYDSVPESSTALVHLPLVAYTSCTLPCASSLHRRLTDSNMLPAGWNASTVAQHDEMSPIDEDSGNGVYWSSTSCAFSHLSYALPAPSCLPQPPTAHGHCASVGIMVNIEHCELLADSPGRLCSVDAVFGIVSTLDGGKFCVGNPDRKFIDLIQSDRHKGSLKDLSGKQHCNVLHST